MKSKLLSLIGMAIILFLFFSISVRSETPRTDLKILTDLDTPSYMNLALNSNSSFVYNNFEFNLYSNINDTEYEIKVDNKSIRSGIIETFKYQYNWRTNKTYIFNIEIEIGNNTWTYNNIFVFKKSIRNVTPETIEPDYTFSELELENYINRIKTKLFLADNLGWAIGGIISYLLIRKYKSSTILEIA